MVSLYVLRSHWKWMEGGSGRAIMGLLVGKCHPECMAECDKSHVWLHSSVIWSGISDRAARRLKLAASVSPARRGAFDPIKRFPWGEIDTFVATWIGQIWSHDLMTYFLGIPFHVRILHSLDGRARVYIMGCWKKSISADIGAWAALQIARHCRYRRLGGECVN